jgi:glycosyltransferase involved in cell wall biosynthesis
MGNAKVLQLLTNSAIGGTERMVLEFVRGTNREKYDLFVGALLSGGSLFSEVSELGAQTVDFNKRRYNEVGVLIKLFSFMKQTRIDLVHLYGLQADVLGRIAARLAGVSVVVSGIRSPELWRKWHHSWLDKGTSGLVDLYISNSEAGRQTTIKREGISPEKIVTIYNGIDMTEFDNPNFDKNSLRTTYGLASSTQVVGVVANLRSMKGHADVIAALPAIVEQIPDVAFMFIGRDNMNGEIQRLAQESGLSEYIIFTGFNPEVRPFYELFDLFLLPSTWEGCPVSILEAMAMGKPVVGTTVGGIPELVVEGQTGLLIPPHNPVAIASSVVSLLKKPDEARKMGQAGRARVEEHFTLPEMVRKIETVYDKLLTT